MKIIPRCKPKFPTGVVNLLFNLLKQKRLIVGEDITKFEKELAEYIGVKHVILVSSGRLALNMILNYFKINDKAEIILPAYTCPAVPSVVVSSGAVPVFIDADPGTFNINPDLIESYFTKNTKAIIATHIEGQPCNLERIVSLASKYDLKIIEDCAQALGARYNGRRVGSIGDVAYFSFGAGKQLNTIGGGAIATNDDSMMKYLRNEVGSHRLSSQVRIIRKFIFIFLAQLFTKPILFDFFIFPLICISNLFKKDIINLFFEDRQFPVDLFNEDCEKYTNFQAVLGLAQLKSLEKDNKKRIQNAEVLNKYLNPAIRRQSKICNVESVYLYYGVRLNNRSKFKDKLLRYGIDTQESWNVCCPSLELFKDYYTHSPVAKRLENEVLYIPNHPGLDEKDLERTYRTINKLISQ